MLNLGDLQELAGTLNFLAVPQSWFEQVPNHVDSIAAAKRARLMNANQQDEKPAEAVKLLQILALKALDPSDPNEFKVEHFLDLLDCVYGLFSGEAQAAVTIVLTSALLHCLKEQELLQFIKPLLKREVEAYQSGDKKDGDTFLRGATLFSKLTFCFVQYRAQKYLKSFVNDFVENELRNAPIYDEDKPTVVNENVLAECALQFLRKFIAAKIPTSIVSICSHLRVQLQQNALMDEEVSLKMSSFMLLRIVSPYLTNLTLKEQFKPLKNKIQKLVKFLQKFANKGKLEQASQYSYLETTLEGFKSLQIELQTFLLALKEENNPQTGINNMFLVGEHYDYRNELEAKMRSMKFVGIPPDSNLQGPILDGALEHSLGRTGLDTANASSKGGSDQPVDAVAINVPPHLGSKKNESVPLINKAKDESAEPCCTCCVPIVTKKRAIPAGVGFFGTGGGAWVANHYLDYLANEDYRLWISVIVIAVIGGGLSYLLGWAFECCCGCNDAAIIPVTTAPELPESEPYSVSVGSAADFNRQQRRRTGSLPIRLHHSSVEDHRLGTLSGSVDSHSSALPLGKRK